MADNLTAKWSASDSNESLPIRFEDVGGAGVLYGVTIIAQADGTLLSTFPISAASLPLPTGAATAAKQPALGTAGTASSDVITVQGVAGMTAVAVSAASLPLPSGASTEATLSTLNGKVTACDTGSVTVASSALPTGGSTSAKQDVIIAGLTSIDGHVDGLETSLASVDAKITACNTGAVVVSSSALPSGAATSARQDTGNTSLASIDTKIMECNTGAVVLAAGTASIGKLAANSGVTIGAVEIASAQTLATVSTVTTVTTCSTVTTLTGSGVAHDAADSGNPHKIGAKATTALSGLTLVADADRTDLRAGVDGVLINRPHTGLEDIVSGNASNTDGTSTQCIAASGAGVKTYLQTIILTNTSSSNTYCEIKDGTTVKLTIPVPANGGAVVNLPVPIGGTANTAWNFDPGAATTTMYCSMVGWKSKV